MSKVKEKSNMDILNEIRNQRNAEITKMKRTDIFITCIEFLGDGEKSKQKIFRLIEKQEFEDKPTMNFEKYYIYENDEPKLIGVRNPENGEILSIGIKGDQNKDWATQKEDIEQCIEDRERQLKAIAKELGISEEEIENLSEIDLTQKIMEKDEEDLTEKENEEEKDENSDTKKLNQEQAKSISSAGNEISLNAQVDTKGTTLGKELGLEEYSKIAVVHSYKLTEINDENGEKGKKENLKFGLVGQKPDGSYETISTNKIRMYRGSNTEITGIKNPQEVETSNNDCIFEVRGSNKRLAIRQTDPYGIPDVYLAQATKENDGNIAQKVQDKYDGTERTNVEVRQLFNKNKGSWQIDRMHDEAEQHEKNGCKDLDIDEVDGNPNTGHQHKINEESIITYNGKEMTIAEIADLPRFKISPKEFVRIYNEKAEKIQDDSEFEDIYNEIEETVNDDLTNPTQR